jgi:outer membrane protein assembly factor BamB
MLMCSSDKSTCGAGGRLWQSLIKSVTIGIALFSLSPATFANGWTGFQGPVPEGANVEAVPMTWSPEEGLLWKVEITGYGQSSPVTWGGRAYVTSISGAKKEHCHVTAFDLETGKVLWKHDLDAATQTESSNYISKAAPTPVVDAEGVICFFEGGNLVALNHEGQVRWQRNLVEEFGPIESRHGLAASLEQSDSHVFVWVERQAEPYVMGVQKATGREDWKVAGLGVTSWASPRLIPVKDHKHLVLSGIGRIAGLDPVTGKSLWNFTEIKGNSTPTPVPVADSRFLIGATAGRGEGEAGKAAESNGLIEIKAAEDGTFKAEFVWKAKRATSSFGSPLAHRGHAYYVNASGVLFCLDLETGEERYSNRLGDSIWATPIAFGDRIGIFGKGGTVSIVSSGETFDKLAENVTWEAQAADPAASRNPGGAPVLYAAVYVNDRLLLRRGDVLYCIASKR